MVTHGHESPLPKDEFDLDIEGIEFSVYSPQRKTMTWQLLFDVAEGLNQYLLDKMNDREVFFRVLDGPGNWFVGYGHVVRLRGPVKSE